MVRDFPECIVTPPVFLESLDPGESHDPSSGSIFRRLLNAFRTSHFIKHLNPVPALRSNTRTYENNITHICLKMLTVAILVVSLALECSSIQRFHCIDSIDCTPPIQLHQNQAGLL